MFIRHSLAGCRSEIMNAGSTVLRLHIQRRCSFSDTIVSRCGTGNGLFWQRSIAIDVEIKVHSQTWPGSWPYETCINASTATGSFVRAILSSCSRPSKTKVSKFAAWRYLLLIHSIHILSQTRDICSLEVFIAEYIKYTSFPRLAIFSHSSPCNLRLL